MAKTDFQKALAADLEQAEELDEIVDAGPLDWMTSQRECVTIQTELDALLAKKKDLTPEVFSAAYDRLKAKLASKQYDRYARREAILRLVRRRDEIREFHARNLQRRAHLCQLEANGASSEELLNERRQRDEIVRVTDKAMTVNISELLTTAAPEHLALEFHTGERFTAEMGKLPTPTGWIGESWNIFKDNVRATIAELREHLENDDSKTLAA